MKLTKLQKANALVLFKMMKNEADKITKSKNHDDDLKVFENIKVLVLKCAGIDSSFLYISKYMDEKDSELFAEIEEICFTDDDYKKLKITYTIRDNIEKYYGGLE